MKRTIFLTIAGFCFVVMTCVNEDTFIKIIIGPRNLRDFRRFLEPMKEQGVHHNETLVLITGYYLLRPDINK
jgi:hypothetical protein